MKDLSLSFEKHEHNEDYFNKFQKNEIEFDCHGMSFSDTCSSVTILKII